MHIMQLSTHTFLRQVPAGMYFLTLLLSPWEQFTETFLVRLSAKLTFFASLDEQWLHQFQIYK